MPTTFAPLPSQEGNPGWQATGYIVFKQNVTTLQGVNRMRVKLKQLIEKQLR